MSKIDEIRARHETEEGLYVIDPPCFSPMYDLAHQDRAYLLERITYLDELVRNLRETIEGDTIDIHGLVHQREAAEAALEAIAAEADEWSTDYYDARDCAKAIDEILAKRKG